MLTTKPVSPDARPKRTLALLLAGSLTLGSGLWFWQYSDDSFAWAAEAVVIAPPVQDIPASGANQAIAIFAGGCFWGVEGVFQHVQGVRQVLSGYAGGTANSARYSAVSSGRTGHAEAVEVTFDPEQVSYGTLLQIFFSVAHDPTELNRQGPDVGTQYRSAIFPVDTLQQQVAQAYIAQLDAGHAYRRPIVTRIENNTGFYPAETYHQDFLAKNPHHPYIVTNDLPKIAQLKQLFPQRYRETPVLGTSP
ncbi:peptide-methionine (S)-S-oxide reductase MsrA [Azomonas macrocytogenes]|uniref:Peptide methionine sulfoxide reductase MsrA n=1 Tax=Azomonas macrocytogenes TaxID=69962 RepID=A0A839SZM3_AZOMA|nr:peptide-methionine (S)-S-oxide reductase MsrA [Azomonas macrocytogenes]MBB3102781.1 peptide-methionine (S)-S-oxide reductase [Azomonas macrocytogenes]